MLGLNKCRQDKLLCSEVAYLWLLAVREKHDMAMKEHRKLHQNICPSNPVVTLTGRGCIRKSFPNLLLADLLTEDATHLTWNLLQKLSYQITLVHHMLLVKLLWNIWLTTFWCTFGMYWIPQYQRIYPPNQGKMTSVLNKPSKIPNCNHIYSIRFICQLLKKSQSILQKVMKTHVVFMQHTYLFALP